MGNGHSIALEIDGVRFSLTPASMAVNADGTVTVQYTPVGEGVKSVNTEEKAPNTEQPYIRSYMAASCMVRFMHEGQFATAAVTHCTDRAVRIFNLELGAAWLPKNVLRWSEIAGQLCVVEADYWLDFTQDISEGMNEYPVLFDPDTVLCSEFI